MPINPLSSYCWRSYGLTMLAVFGVIFSLFLLIVFGQLVFRFSEFDLPVTFLLPILWSKIPEAVLFSLNLAVFFAVVVSLQNLNRSGQRVAMQAVGLGYAWHMRQLLVLLLPLALIIAWLALVLLPQSLLEGKLAERQAEEQINVEFQSNSLKTYTNGNNELMISTHNQIADNEFADWVLVINQANKHYLVSARQGEYQSKHNQRWLNLEQVRLVHDLGSTLSVSVAAEMRLSLEPFLGNNQLSVTENVRSESSLTLIDELLASTKTSRDSNQSLGELCWRLSFVLNGLVLPLLAVLLVPYRPRRESTMHSVIPLLILLVYSRLLDLVRQNVESGQWLAGPSYAGFYGMVILGVIVLLVWREKRC